MLSTHPIRINNTNQLFKTEIMKQLEINIHLKYVTLKGDFNSEGATGIVVFSMEVAAVDSVPETKW
jgi:hypothetical protein